MVEVPPSPGVVAVLGPSDIPGRNDVAAVGQNEPLFAVDEVSYLGQPLLLVVARTLDAARHAAERAVIDIEELPALLDVEAALAEHRPKRPRRHGSVFAAIREHQHVPVTIGARARYSASPRLACPRKWVRATISCPG